MTRLGRTSEHYLLQALDEEKTLPSEDRRTNEHSSPGVELLDSLEVESRNHLLDEYEFMERYFPGWKENSQKVIRASTLVEDMETYRSKLWPQEEGVEYAKQELTMPPNSPPWRRYGREAEYHCLGPAELTEHEDKRRRQDNARKLVPSSTLRPTAKSWHPPGFSTEPQPIARQDVWTLSSEEFWEDYIIHKPDPKCIARPPLRFPIPTSSLPNHLPQFGIKQHCFAKVPETARDYKIFVKPGVRGYAKGVAREIIDAWQCVIIHIWVPKDSSSWVCDACYAKAKGWNLVEIHRVGLKEFHHMAQCPGCGCAPYRVQEVSKCGICRWVSWIHLPSIYKGNIICAYPAETRVDDQPNSDNR
ncbi:hypothetical protein QAD02_008339 [Eretmocerus hayati]|uniref:Uncharacterized protein n=1 Tax=Eretmocerus hayati TaxID=131215 RepID=A0ACC2N696_9HYME|nr:hypothetical protein QAD02_008339 [Eretmocerus hayati]